jgi:hypothetical protein
MLAKVVDNLRLVEGLAQVLANTGGDMSIGVRAATRGSHAERAFCARMLTIVLFLFGFLMASGMNTAAGQAQTEEKNGKDSQEVVRAYLDEPTKNLVKQVPELKGLRPVEDQQPLEGSGRIF